MKWLKIWKGMSNLVTTWKQEMLAHLKIWRIIVIRIWGEIPLFLLLHLDIKIKLPGTCNTRNPHIYVWWRDTWGRELINALEIVISKKNILLPFLDTLACSLVNDQESGTTTLLDSISAHYQSQDMNIFTRFSFPS